MSRDEMRRLKDAMIHSISHLDRVILTRPHGNRAMQPDEMAEWCIDVKQAAEMLAEVADEAEQEYRVIGTVPDEAEAEFAESCEIEDADAEREGWYAAGWMDGNGRCAYTAESWNEWFPPGTRVVLVEDSGDRLMTRTRSEAWALENGHPVVHVEGKVGGYSLTRIKPLSDWKALQEKSEKGGAK